MDMPNDVGMSGDPLCQAPEFQIHLGRGIMRQPTQHRLPLLRLRKIAQELARSRLTAQADNQHRRETANDTQEVPYHMLHPQQTLFGRSAGGDEIHGPYTLSSLLYPLDRRLRPAHRLKGIDGGPRFL